MNTALSEAAYPGAAEDEAMQGKTPTLPDTGFLRLPEVLRYYPVGKSTWWAGIRAGKFPAPVRIGERAVAWRAEDIRELIDRAASAKAAA